MSRPFNEIDASSSGQSDEEIHVPERLTYISFGMNWQFQHVHAHNALAHPFIEMVGGDDLNVLLSLCLFMFPGYVSHTVSMVLVGTTAILLNVSVFILIMLQHF